MYWIVVLILTLVINTTSAQNKRTWQTGHRGDRPKNSSPTPAPSSPNYSFTPHNYQRSYWTFPLDKATTNFTLQSAFRGNALKQFGSQSLPTLSPATTSEFMEYQTDWAEKRLIKDLLSDYEKQSRPVVDKLTPRVWVTSEQVAQQITVEFGLELLQILDLDEMDQVLTTSVRSLYKWTDHNLIWDPNIYGGIDSVTIPTNYLWLPDIALYNYADERLDERRPCDARIVSDGTVHWNPMAIFKSTCSVDIKYFPFDRQKCVLKFGPWSYDGFRVNISFYAGERNFRMTNYMTNPEWIILNSSAIFTEISYPCCPEKYPDISFHIWIKRQSAFYTYILIIPSILLSSLTSVIFWLPPHSPSKIVLAMNVFVAFLLLHLLLEDTTPAAASDFPLLGAYYCFNMGIITVSMFLSCVTVNLHFLTTYTKAPDWLKKYVSVIGSTIAVDVSLLRVNSMSEKFDQTIPSNFSQKQSHSTQGNSISHPSSISTRIYTRPVCDAHQNPLNNPTLTQQYPLDIQMNCIHPGVVYEEDGEEQEEGNPNEDDDSEQEIDSEDEINPQMHYTNNIYPANSLWTAQTRHCKGCKAQISSDCDSLEPNKTDSEPNDVRRSTTEESVTMLQPNYTSSIQCNYCYLHWQRQLSKPLLFEQLQHINTNQVGSLHCRLCHIESVSNPYPYINCMNLTELMKYKSPTLDNEFKSNIWVSKSCHDLSNDASSSTDQSSDFHCKPNAKNKIKQKNNSSPITYFPLANSLKNKLTVARIRKDIHFITNAARQLQSQHGEIEVNNSIKEQWNVIGIVLDRLFFIVYVITLIISSFLFHPTVLHVYVVD